MSRYSYVTLTASLPADLPRRSTPLVLDARGLDRADDPTEAFDVIAAPSWFGERATSVMSLGAASTTSVLGPGVALPAPIDPDAATRVTGRATSGTPLERPVAEALAAAEAGEPRHRLGAASSAGGAGSTRTSRRVLVAVGALGLVGAGFLSSSLLRPDTPPTPPLPPLAADASAALTDPSPDLPAALPPSALPPAPFPSTAPEPSTTPATAAARRPARPVVGRPAPPAVPRAGVPGAPVPGAPVPGAVPPPGVAPGAVPPGAPLAYAPAYAPPPGYAPPAYQTGGYYQTVPQHRERSGGPLGLFR